MKRGAECHTDHNLLRIKLKMTRGCFHLKKKRKTAPQQEVKKDNNDDCEIRKRFRKQSRLESRSHVLRAKCGR